MQKLPKCIAIDTEFNQWEKLLLLTAYDGEKEYAFYPKDCFEFLLWIQRNNIPVIAHNALSDIHIIYKNTGILLTNWHCTYTIAKLVTNGYKVKGIPFKVALNNLLDKMLGIEMSKEERKEFIKMKNESEITQELIDYAIKDVVHLIDLFKVLYPKLKQNKQVFAYNMEMKLLPVVTKIQNNLIYIDKAKITTLANELKEKEKNQRLICHKKLAELNFKTVYIDSYLTKLYKTTNPKTHLKYKQFSIASEHQMKTILLPHFNIPCPEDNKGKKTLGKENLRKWLSENTTILNPFFEEYLKWADISGLAQKADYLAHSTLDFDKDLRVTATMMTTMRTKTGRFSSYGHGKGFPKKEAWKINTQNIPTRGDRGKAFKDSFTCPKGYKVASCDMSQAELVIAAHISQDTFLLDMFRKGYDIHTISACTAYNILNNTNEKWLYKQDSAGYKHTNGLKHRDLAKTFFYAYLNGATAGKLAEVYGVNIETGRKLFKALEEKLYGLSSFIKRQIQFSRKHGYVLSNNICNRLKYHGTAPDITNFYWQSTNADAMKLALICLDHHIVNNQLDAWIMNTVHDSVFIAVREENNDLAWIPSIMAQSLQYFCGGELSKRNGLIAKADLDVGKYWQ